MVRSTILELGGGGRNSMSPAGTWPWDGTAVVEDLDGVETTAGESRASSLVNFDDSVS